MRRRRTSFFELVAALVFLIAGYATSVFGAEGQTFRGIGTYKARGDWQELTQKATDAARVNALGKFVKELLEPEVFRQSAKLIEQELLPRFSSYITKETVVSSSRIGQSAEVVVEVQFDPSALSATLVRLGLVRPWRAHIPVLAIPIGTDGVVAGYENPAWERNPVPDVFGSAVSHVVRNHLAGIHKDEVPMVLEKLGREGNDPVVLVLWNSRQEGSSSLFADSASKLNLQFCWMLHATWRGCSTTKTITYLERSNVANAWGVYPAQNGDDELLGYIQEIRAVLFTPYAVEIVLSGSGKQFLVARARELASEENLDRLRPVVLEGIKSRNGDPAAQRERLLLTGYSQSTTEEMQHALEQRFGTGRVMPKLIERKSDLLSGAQALKLKSFALEWAED